MWMTPNRGYICALALYSGPYMRAVRASSTYALDNSLVSRLSLDSALGIIKPHKFLLKHSLSY